MKVKNKVITLPDNDQERHKYYAAQMLIRHSSNQLAQQLAKKLNNQDIDNLAKARVALDRAQEDYNEITESLANKLGLTA